MNSTMNASNESYCPPRICDVGGHGLILPIFGDHEQRWSPWLRRFLYSGALVWFFLGVAIVSDIFMESIEKITSRKRRVFSKARNAWITLSVWNDTVANLTLMALGSSAPEILLNIVDLLGKGDMYSGDLGPSTIVGSAAFNLLLISAVCVAVIPANEVRYIRDQNVFFVTALFSILAYLWLLAIVAGPWSKDIVEVWEGCVTFALFPIFVATAWLVDRRGFRGKPNTFGEEATAAQISAMEIDILRRSRGGMPESCLKTVLERELGGKRTRATYRPALSSRTSQRNLAVKKESSMDSLTCGKPKNKHMAVVPTEYGSEGQESSGSKEKKKASIEFSSDAYAVLAQSGMVSLTVVRTGDALGCSVWVGYHTRDAAAKAGENFLAAEGELEFKEGVDKKSICIAIVDDEAKRYDEHFYLDLHSPRSNERYVDVQLGKKKTAKVRIVDDGHATSAGQLRFEQETVSVKEAPEDTSLVIRVIREIGTVGEISCNYRTEDATALGGVDFEPVVGQLHFADGQVDASIEVTIKPRDRYDNSDTFRLVLEEMTGGAVFCRDTDGGTEACICTIMIETDQRCKNQFDHLKKAMHSHLEKSKIANQNWRDQFIAALHVNGGESEDPDSDNPTSSTSNGENGKGATWAQATPTVADTGPQASVSEWVLHIASVFWKLFFALIPPTDYCGGWLSFIGSLLMIGLVTAFVADLASLLGCVFEIPDAITAVTVVALGTSLPDTFASKTAAEQDPYADASIGNVTGSNSVNVFLGIGLPWMIGAIYWSHFKGRSKDESRFEDWHKRYRRADSSVTTDHPDGDVFVVLSGTLGFSVVVFSVAALLCLAVLHARRRLLGGELGGPRKVKLATAALLSTLWITFIVLYSWKAMEGYGGCSN